MCCVMRTTPCFAPGAGADGTRQQRKACILSIGERGRGPEDGDDEYHQDEKKNVLCEDPEIRQASCLCRPELLMMFYHRALREQEEAENDNEAAELAAVQRIVTPSLCLQVLQQHGKSVLRHIPRKIVNEEGADELKRAYQDLLPDVDAEVQKFKTNALGATHVRDINVLLQRHIEECPDPSMTCNRLAPVFTGYIRKKFRWSTSTTLCEIYEYYTRKDDPPHTACPVGIALNKYVRSDACKELERGKKGDDDSEEEEESE